MSYNSTKLLKTLTAEDNLIDRKQLERLLSKSTLPLSEIKHAEYPENALALPNTDNFDTAIADLNLLNSSGLNTAGKTERLRFKVGLPFIKTGVSIIVAVLVVTSVLGAFVPLEIPHFRGTPFIPIFLTGFVCRYDTASCTHKLKY